MAPGGVHCRVPEEGKQCLFTIENTKFSGGVPLFPEINTVTEFNVLVVETLRKFLNTAISEQYTSY